MTLKKLSDAELQARFDKLRRKKPWGLKVWAYHDAMVKRKMPVEEKK